jgi:hypothetical protein
VVRAGATPVAPRACESAGEDVVTPPWRPCPSSLVSREDGAAVSLTDTPVDTDDTPVDTDDTPIDTDDTPVQQSSTTRTEGFCRSLTDSTI